MHEKVQCTQCHGKPIFTDVGKNCADCHADVHRRQNGSDCQQCHTVQGWSITPQQVKDHQNRFPLLGSHTALQCEQCHKQAATGIFLGLSTQCDSCHLKDWQHTTNPNHPSAGPAFASANCQGCHAFDTFLKANFNHSSTGFPLTNGHANVPCTSCHINNNYNLTIQPNDCGNSGCHLSTWQQTNSPTHPNAGPAFAAANCSNCHNTVSWTTATFDHSSTGFALTNGHANVPCAACHINNNYNLTIQPNDCGNSGCHLTTWQQTNNPTHSTAGAPFATANCASCHNTVSWTTATFDHSTTGWPLTGTHVTTTCAQCHTNNNYNFTSANANCYGCHTSDWTSTQTLGGTVPNHVAAAFPTSLCSTCHDTVVWSDGKFDHSATGWPLTGAHQLPPAAGSKVNGCADCHIGNNYNLTSSNTACYGCHTAAWQSTQTLGGTVPNHIAAGYPTTCDACHTTTTWLNATFNHTYFPIPHHSSVCSDCHQVSTNYASFTCINCHTTTFHTQSQEVPRHADVPGFSYGPTTCYDCHKNGGGG
jgi:Cytochrome c7 and related cytochrome c